MTAVIETARVRAASRAVYAAFILLGFARTSWASRIPQIRDALGLSPSRLGLVLLAIAAGSMVSLPLAGPLVANFGSRRTVTATAAMLTISLAGAAVGYRFGVAPLCVALFAVGFAMGAWDVAMNVQGALVERRLGKAIMPRFHAGFSVGTVAGALVGAGAVALDLSVTAHLVVAAVIAGAVVIPAVRTFVPDGPASRPPAAPTDAALGGSAAPVTARSGRLRRALASWREPRTVLIGVFVLAFAFTEASGVDWISVAMIDDYRAPAVVGTLAFAVFLSAVTIARWFGPAFLDRYGRVRVVRVLAVVSLFGLLLFVFGTVTPVAFAGALLWGLGVSLGFPVGMSAAADDPARAAPRVSVVASIGYFAYLGGPPFIGFLGDRMTVQRGLIAVAVLLAVAIGLAGWVRPPNPE